MQPQRATFDVARASGRREDLPAAGSWATAPTLDGPALNAVKLRGRTLVVNFWASWCATCWAEQADLNTVPARERPLGIQFLGVDMDDSAASAQANVQQFKIDYASLVDPTNGIGRRYQIFSPLSIRGFVRANANSE